MKTDRELVKEALRNTLKWIPNKKESNLLDDPYLKLIYEELIREENDN